MDNRLVEPRRKSHMEIGEIYFWTATINNWRRLLYKDEYKNVVVSSLQHLSNEGKIDVFAFVIMPNHVHLIWRINSDNGKETSQSSFLKYTAHEFKKMLVRQDVNHSDLVESALLDYKVKADNKGYEFWQRDSLAVHLYTKDVAYQKLDYIHYNPVAEHWRLVKDICDYKYSTARFYEMGISDFSFIKDLREEF